MKPMSAHLKLRRALEERTVRAVAALPAVYTIASDGCSITCHVCGFTSWNLNDVALKYCGRCKEFHDQLPSLPSLESLS